MILILPFSGCQFKTSYGMKDMERHLRTHTGLYSCYILFLVCFLLLAFRQKVFSYKIMYLYINRMECMHIFMHFSIVVVCALAIALFG